MGSYDQDKDFIPRAAGLPAAVGRWVISTQTATPAALTNIITNGIGLTIRVRSVDVSVVSAVMATGYAQVLLGGIPIASAVSASIAADSSGGNMSLNYAGAGYPVGNPGEALQLATSGTEAIAGCSVTVEVF